MNLKELMEKRNDLVDQIENLTKNVETEQRAFTQEEDAQVEELTKAVEDIDKTIEQCERAQKFTKVDIKTDNEEESTEDIEIRAFANIIRERGDSNITKTDNGAVIPKTIAKKIVDKIKDISPLFRDAEKFNVKGNLSIPYVDGSNDNITVAYASEFTDLEAKSTKLLSVDLSGYLAGVLAKISISLLNSTDVDLVDFVVNKMAAAAASFIDKEILDPVDASNKITGLSNASQIVYAGSTSAISADVLIKLKNQLKSAFQSGAYFVMHPETLTAVQLLKDNNNRYIFNDEIQNGFSGTILGKPVYTSDQCPKIDSGNDAIFYINPAQALAVKMVEDSVTILRERYATQHALGVVEWLELDAKIQNQQAVAVLNMSIASV
ncbi:MAG: phage major capsid protein [Lachnospiraceae bacterium]|nr:phage major capsid protein [Lachnospiraceae bacterium]